MPSLVALYRLADFCIVSSLHDGMNLVAKEFVAARDDDDGVLVLSALPAPLRNCATRSSSIRTTSRFRRRASSGARHAAQERRSACGHAAHGRGTQRLRWASDILEGLESLWTRPWVRRPSAAGHAGLTGKEQAPLGQAPSLTKRMRTYSLAPSRHSGSDAASSACHRPAC